MTRTREAVLPKSLRNCSKVEFNAAVSAFSLTLFDRGGWDDPCEFARDLYYETQSGSVAEDWALDAFMVCPDLVGAVR